MARQPSKKELKNTRLANTYGGWIYCEQCGKSIGYLCYVTYDSFQLEYQCQCGGEGSMQISFDTTSPSQSTDNPLILIKNRLCCPNDKSPLFSIIEKNLQNYSYEVVCHQCNTKYVNKNYKK